MTIPKDINVRLALLDRIHQQAGLTEKMAERWQQNVRNERLASGRRRLAMYQDQTTD